MTSTISIPITDLRGRSGRRDPREDGEGSVQVELDPARLRANLDRMMASCERFIDSGTIDVIPTGQYSF